MKKRDERVKYLKKTYHGYKANKNRFLLVSTPKFTHVFLFLFSISSINWRFRVG